MGRLPPLARTRSIPPTAGKLSMETYYPSAIVRVNSPNWSFLLVPSDGSRARIPMCISTDRAEEELKEGKSLGMFYPDASG